MEAASHSLARVEEATGRLLTSAGKLDDDQVREPSALPGWTRGHVLTHIARNADGMVNLLAWARTGVPAPMYASAAARAADVEAGSGRRAADLAADVHDSAQAFAAAAAAMPDQAWGAAVRALHGPPFPAIGVLERRLSEVEIHHVDLAAGYSPADWPADFVAAALPRVAASFTGRDDAPSLLVWADGTPGSFPVGPEHPGAATLTVHGPPADLLAWLTGRGPGTGLTTDSGAPLPALPPWR